MVRISFLSLLILVLLSSCYEDSIIDTTTTSTITPGQRVVHDVSGYVLDINGDPISGAFVKRGDVNVIADQDGFFEAKRVTIEEGGSYISASQIGYVTAGSTVFPTTSLEAQTIIVLIEEELVSNFNASTGGRISGPDGLSLDFPPNSIASGGTDFSGDVSLSIVYQNLTDISPEQRSQRVNTILSEDMIIDKVLNGLVAFEITLEDEIGNALDIKEGVTVKGMIPIPQSTSGALSLYSLDLEEGAWREEQSINAPSGLAEVEFTHFSWWAIGVPADAITLCIDFTAVNGPGPTDDAFFLSDNEAFLGYGNISYVDQQCILVPMSEDLSLVVYNYCLIEKHREVITSSSSDQQVVIDVDQSISSFTISGDFKDCNGDILTNEVSVGVTNTYRYNLAETFTGSYIITLNECVNIESSQLTFFDDTNKVIKEIDLNTLSPGDNNLDITLCAEEAVSSFFELGGVALKDCIARQNPEETLLSLEDADGRLLMGFDGFGTGSFDTRIYTGGEYFEGTVDITKYGDVNQTIEGTISVVEISSTSNVTGSFVAKRIR